MGEEDAASGHFDSRPLELLLKEGRSGLEYLVLVEAECINPLVLVVLSRRLHQHGRQLLLVVLAENNAETVRETSFLSHIEHGQVKK